MAQQQMTPEEAKKLVKPLVWMPWGTGFLADIQVNDTIDLEMQIQEKVDGTFSASLKFGFEYLVEFKGYETPHDVMMVADKWWEGAIIGFLNLEGGEG